MLDMTNEVTAFLIGIDEPSIQECRERLQAQTATIRIVEILGVRPMWRAFQQMLDTCQTPLFVQVDADMLLNPTAIAELHSGLESAGNTFAMFVGWLWGDIEQRPIQGVKIYRHDVCRHYPYGDGLSCEIEQLRKMQEAGHGVAICSVPAGKQKCLGLHKSEQTPAMAYRRCQRLMVKHRRLPGMLWLSGLPSELLSRYQRKPTATAFAALCGAIAGLSVDHIEDAEIDFERLEHAYRRTIGCLGDGPTQVNLYVTDRCNLKCWFCRRQHKKQEARGNMDPRLPVQIAVAYPTITSACIAGFGEPLMHPDIEALVTSCRSVGWGCTIITNGTLLKQRAQTMLGLPLTSLSVSMNASSREEYLDAHGVDAWDEVTNGLDAIRDARYPVGASFVVTRANVERVETALDMCVRLGLDFVDLHNLLPHGGNGDSRFLSNVITKECPELLVLDQLRASGRFPIVRAWATPISLTDACPVKCDSPFVSIGIDAWGFITGCRRIASPQEFAPNAWEGRNFSANGAWHSMEIQRLRLSLSGDQPVQERCRLCFGNW